MARIRLSEETQSATLDYYFNLPVVEQLALLWDESGVPAPDSPVADLPGCEIVAYWDMDPWLSPFMILVYMPRGRFGFRRSLAVDINFYNPEWSAEYVLGSGVEREALDKRDLPDLVEAREILSESEDGPRTAAALLALGRQGGADDLAVVERRKESGDRMISYVAEGAIAINRSLLAEAAEEEGNTDPPG